MCFNLLIELFLVVLYLISTKVFRLSKLPSVNWLSKHCPPQSNPWYQTHQPDSLSSRPQVGLALKMSFDLEILDFEQNANQVYSIFFWIKLYLRNFYFRGPQHLIKLGAGTHTMAKLQEHLELRFLSIIIVIPPVTVTAKVNNQTANTHILRPSNA